MAGELAPAVAGRIGIAIRPRPQPGAGLSVSVELTGAAVSRIAALVATPSWAGVRAARNVRELQISDGHGPMAFRADEEAGRYALGRPAAGPLLRASYFAAAGDPASRFDVQVDAQGAHAVGHAFLLLPELDERLAVTLRWDLAELGAATGASSFGVGEEIVTVARPRELAHSVYLAGRLSVLEPGFGERLIVRGEPSFAQADAASACSTLLGAARRSFEPEDRQPFSFIWLPRPHLGVDHDGASLWRSFALWFDENRGLDARLRVLAAHEIVHRWIGPRIRLRDERGGDAAWFSEGFTTHFARALAHRTGLLTDDEFLDSLNHSVDVDQQAFDGHERPAGGAPAASSSAAAASPPSYAEPDGSHHDPFVIHHGSLYAALVDAELRARRGTGLDALLTALMASAAETDGALPVSAWREAVVDALGAAAGAELDRLVLRVEEPIDPPAGAYGPCIVRLVSKHASYELGFDPASLKAEPPVVHGLVAGSQAERAGLRNGDVLLLGHRAVKLGDTSREVELQVSGARGPRLVRYSPVRAGNRTHWEVSAKCRR